MNCQQCKERGVRNFDYGSIAIKQTAKNLRVRVTPIHTREKRKVENQPSIIFIIYVV